MSESNEEEEVLLHGETPRASPFGRVKVAAAVGASLLLVAGMWRGTRESKPSIESVEGPFLQKWEACTDNGKDCSKSKCCNDPNSHCFRKNDHWASCNASCSQNWLWVDGGWKEQKEKHWNCMLLSPAHDGMNCMESKACKNPGSKCYKKNDHWASCNRTCNEKRLWNHDKKKWEDHTEKVWDCSVLSPTADGENCYVSRTCLNPKSKCYRKNKHWASCNPHCDQHMLWENGGWTKKKGKVWDCHVLSCTHDGEDCTHSGCCRSPGSQCFKKNDHWASCNATCDPNMKWVEKEWQRQDDKIWNCSVHLPKTPTPDDEEEAPVNASDPKKS